VHELIEEERVARTGRVHGLQELRRRLTREPCSEKLRNRIEAERSRTHERREGLGLEAGEDRRVHAGFPRPHCGRNNDRKPVKSSNEVGQEAGRGRVAPVELVDREQHRREFSEVRGQPEKPVQCPVRSVLPADERIPELAELEERRSQAGRSDKELCALILAECGQTRLEELTDDSVREVPLELASSGAQHLEPEGLRLLACGAEQA
jgi:hypothetical protein